MKKYESGGKIITKLATTAPKTYSYGVKKDDHEIEDSEFIKGKVEKRLASKELTFHNFVKSVRCCYRCIKNTSLTKEQISFRSY